MKHYWDPLKKSDFSFSAREGLDVGQCLKHFLMPIHFFLKTKKA